MKEIPQPMIPLLIEPEKESEATRLKIIWKNPSTQSDEVSLIPYFDLRFECPCAKCVDEFTGVRTLKKESISPTVKVTGAERVGRYAIQFKFSDGHQTGIYPYEQLMLMWKNQKQNSNQ